MECRLSYAPGEWSCQIKIRWEYDENKRLEEVKEVLEALLALEVQLRVVRPDVLAHLERDEEVEHAHLALCVS